ncbi:NAD-dependent epimerase/dehydratase [Candidatus Scalindua japonica]|uniref:UDP-glucuronate decarboxylase n=1 Tax=Candidatus Scalindua japonica TaxID=1284222 RepID=A0A286TX32_9BACT|nr:GDP-mannose 4,6-dehydratase [Candidatus Scalindua japonica]GAX60449.1 NAD-dependent epimerase/dehydratase [Candidatus Scalindua japonica]
MQVLVTGGAGFIGSHLCERLLEDGHRVVAIDDLSTGNTENLTGCMENKDFSFFSGSVLDEQAMHTLVSKSDIIYHLAAAVGVKLIIEQPVRTIETNIKGTEVTLNLAKKFGKKVLIASTSEVYGKSERVPFREDDDCLLGSTTFSRWSYACSKAVDEFLGLAYCKQYGVPVLIIRLFNTVGERQTGQYGMVVPRFVEAALSGKPLLIYGDGRQTRCFAYVKDVINGMIALVNNSSSYGNVYNIGSTEEITINKLAEKIKKMTGSSSTIRYVPYKEAYGQAFDDMKRRIPCIDKIQNHVDYNPEISLDDTLGIIIDYLRKDVNSNMKNVLKETSS